MSIAAAVAETYPERIELIDVEKWIKSLPTPVIRKLALGPSHEHHCRVCDALSLCDAEGVLPLHNWHRLTQEEANDERAQILSATRCMVIYQTAKLELKERYPR